MGHDSFAAVLHESRVFEPSTSFKQRARLGSRTALEAVREEARRDANGFWAQRAREEISWHRPFTRTLDATRAPHYAWFTDGVLNASYNCLDRHLAERANKTAIVFEGEKGDVRHLSYRELHRQVCCFAQTLKHFGVRKGDRVVILLPNVPQAVVAMQACARIGAIHSVVFGGFSAESLKDRIEDAGATAVITADGGFRGGKVVPLKPVTDQALAKGCATVKTVVVLRRAGQPVNMQQGRDVWWHEAESQARLAMGGAVDSCVPEWVDAEHPLFLLYTSGSTGKPKGVQHSTAGYLLGAQLSLKWVFDLRDNDVFWCTADVGWITGHTYVAYGPLALGATMVMYEGGPTTPGPDRFWDICARHKVTIFYTAPTAIRALMRFGDDCVSKHDLSHLRLLGTVGEPINPEAWMWYHTVVGGERCPIVDTWWQTETGSIMMAPVPGAVATKPGSCTLPLPGIEPEVVDENGEIITEPEQGGALVITKPWPSMLRTIWGDDQRYVDTYWSQFGGKYYVAGDSAYRDKDGYFWILGRLDDVLNVSGHRLGTMEVESALVAHQQVAEAAVVGCPHPVKGEAISAFVVTRGEVPTGSEAEALAGTLRTWVGEQIGAIAKPDAIRLVGRLPKTRSGKIMRRLLRTLARGEAVTQDTSTLEDQSVLEQLQSATAYPRPASAGSSSGSGATSAKNAPVQASA